MGAVVCLSVHLPRYPAGPTIPRLRSRRPPFKRTSKNRVHLPSFHTRAPRSSPQLGVHMSQDGEVTREEGCHTSMAHSSPLLGVLVLQEDPRTGILRLSPQSSQFSLGMAYSNSMSSSSSVKQRHMQRSRSSFNAPFQ
eukprot:1159963-Pelagomonas_calceolata.AAC.1